MQQEPQTNRQRFEEAGIIPSTYEFSSQDLAVIESLTSQEVQSIIDVAAKLGHDFLLEHGGGPTAGILF